MMSTGEPDLLFQINARSQVFIVKELATFALGYIGVYLFVVRIYSPDSQYIMTPLFIYAFLITEVIPSSIIHFQYLWLNKHVQLRLNAANRTLTVRVNDICESFHFDEVRRVEIYLVSALYRGRKAGWSVWDRYHYAIVEIDGGKQFVITCLLMNDLRQFFKDIQVSSTWKRVIFPVVLLTRYKAKDAAS